MAESKEKKVQTTIRIPLSLKQRLDDEVNRRKYTPERITIDGAFQEAISAWLGNTQNYDSGLTKSDDPPEIHAGKPDSRKKPSQMADDALISSGASGTGGTNKSDPQGDPSGMASDIRALKERLASVEARIARRGKGDGAAGKRKQS